MTDNRRGIDDMRVLLQRQWYGHTINALDGIALALTYGAPSTTRMQREPQKGSFYIQSAITNSPRYQSTGITTHGMTD